MADCLSSAEGSQLVLKRLKQVISLHHSWIKLLERQPAIINQPPFCLLINDASLILFRLLA